MRATVLVHQFWHWFHNNLHNIWRGLFKNLLVILNAYFEQVFSTWHWDACLKWSSLKSSFTDLCVNQQHVLNTMVSYSKSSKLKNPEQFLCSLTHTSPSSADWDLDQDSLHYPRSISINCQFIEILCETPQHNFVVFRFRMKIIGGVTNLVNQILFWFWFIR